MALGRFAVERGEGRLTLRTRRADAVRVLTALMVPWAIATELAAFVSWKIYTVVSMLLVILAWLWMLLFTERLSTRGGYGVVRRLVDIRPAEATGYRDRARVTITIDDQTFDVARVRAIFQGVQRRYRSPDSHQVILALDDRVFEVDASNEVAEMRALAEALRDALRLGAIEAPKEPAAKGGVAVMVISLLSFFLLMGIVIGPATATGNREPTPMSCLFGAPAVIAAAWAVAALLGRLSRDTVRQDVEARYGISVQNS